MDVIAWNESEMDKLEVRQNRIARIALNAPRYAAVEALRVIWVGVHLGKGIQRRLLDTKLGWKDWRMQDWLTCYLWCFIQGSALRSDEAFGRASLEDS